MAAAARGVRVKLDFLFENNFANPKRCWYFVDFIKLSLIKDLRREIKHQYGVSRVDLFVDGYVLSPELPIHTVHENDHIEIRLSQIKRKREISTLVVQEEPEVNGSLSKPKKKKKRTKRIEICDNETEEILLNGSTKSKKKKRKVDPSEHSPIPVNDKTDEKKCNDINNTRTEGSDIEDASVEVSKVTSEKRRRRRRSRNKPNKDIPLTPETGEESRRIASPRIEYVPTTKPKSHIRFDEDDTSTPVPTTQPSLRSKGTTNEVIESQEKEQKSPGVLNEAKLASLSALEGPPRVGDTIAFKELVLSADYTPEVSDYQIAKVLAWDADARTVTLDRITKNNRTPGKFDIETDDLPMEQQNNICSLESLIEAKLFTP